MNYLKNKIKKCLTSILVLLSLIFVVQIVFTPIYSMAQSNLSTGTNNDSIILNQKVDLLEEINSKILNSVYWTLGILAAIFLGLISVNLYFNITGNKNEIRRIREDIIRTTNNLIETAKNEIADKLSKSSQHEALSIKENLIETMKNMIETAKNEIDDKLSKSSQQEIKDQIGSLSVSSENQLLEYKSEVNKKINDFEKILISTQNVSRSNKVDIDKIHIDIKELEAYRYSKEGKMGGIINQVELLEHDIEKRYWNLESRLKEIRNEVKAADLYPDLAEKLESLLKKIKDPVHKVIIEEIKKSITIRRQKP